LTEVPAARDRVEISDRVKPLELVPLALSDLLIVSIQEISAHIEFVTGLALPRRKEAHAEGAGNAGNARHADGPACHALAATQIRL
jgi:hypothetical protein